jgi:outer membrane protein assembly factor BamE (lipoprotein component of BamABCDE complex)
MARAHHLFRKLVVRTSICGLAGLSLLTSACSTELDTHGDRIEADRLAQIRPGVQTRNEVAAILGSPSSTSVFGDESWYYVSDLTEKHSIFDTKVKERQVVAIRFNGTGLVSEVQAFGIERGREVELVDRETPTLGESVTVLNQIFGNIGRFNQADMGRPRRGPPSPNQGY